MQLINLAVAAASALEINVADDDRKPVFKRGKMVGAPGQPLQFTEQVEVADVVETSPLCTEVTKEWQRSTVIARFNLFGSNSPRLAAND